MNGTPDRELDATSRRLLDTMGEMRRLEEQKRQTGRSSEEFHELADEVAKKADDVWRVAHDELREGEEDSPLHEEHEDGGPGDWTARDEPQLDGR